MQVIYKTDFGLAIQDFEETFDFKYLIINDDILKKLETFENPTINEDYADIIENKNNLK